MPRAARAPGLFDDEARLPDGFLYQPDFITPGEEQRLLEGISQLQFGDVRMHGVTARRRVVQLGWKYSFDSRALAEARPIPPFLEFLQQRAALAAGVEPARFSEVLVTEYRPGATIGWHRDAPPFGIVAGASLASSCRFRLRRQVGDGWERTELIAEPRSLYVLAGEARSEWQHSIPAVEQLRYSITFRTLRKS